MADLNIDDFYRDVAIILLRLYSSFPRPEVLYVDDISGPDAPDEFGLHSERHQACFSAMTCLAQEGYIHFDAPIRREALDQTVLSRRGFLMLNSRSEMFFGDERHDDFPPSLMEHSRTNVNQLRHTLRENSSIMLRQCVHQLLSLPAQ